MHLDARGHVLLEVKYQPGITAVGEYFDMSFDRFFGAGGPGDASCKAREQQARDYDRGRREPRSARIALRSLVPRVSIGLRGFFVMQPFQPARLPVTAA